MYYFIINPTAGNGRSKKLFSILKRSQLYRQIDSTYFITEYKGHAEEITKQILRTQESITCVIIIGGDGTLHEVINGLYNTRTALAFIPGGSGNDFARGCKINGKPLAIFEQIIKGENRIPYWLGNYQIDNECKRLFVNSIGFGFDAEIAQDANESRYKKLLSKFHLGTLSYCIALLKVLVHFKPRTIEIEINGNNRVQSNCWMITIANHPYYGGGMKIIPHAKIQPRTFPVLLVHSISKWKVLALFLTVFTGKHVNFKEVELLEATNLTIVSGRIIPYQADGQTGMCRSCVISRQNEPIIVNGRSEWISDVVEEKVQM